MSVVKTLALGALILGSSVVPTLAGSIRPSHRIPDRPNIGSSAAPTSLVYGGSTVSPQAENLAAGNRGNLPSNSFSSVWYAGGYTAPAGISSLSYGNSYQTTSAAVPAAAATSFAPVASYTPAPAASYMPAAASAPVASAPSSGHSVDAFLNFGNAPYSEAQSLTTGNPQSWTQSPIVQSVFGGTPTQAQQQTFVAEVLQTVTKTYNQSGLGISLTVDPTQNYAHTMSIVSGASYTGNSSAIGITDVGNDGFSFIDKFTPAKTPDELAAAVGHNVAHELMHAFGIANHPDQTGNYLDAASANWSILTNPNTAFSPQAISLLSTQNFLNGPGKDFTQGAMGLSGLELLTEHHPVTCHCPLCNALHKLEASEGLSVNGASTVPEPATMALWGLAGCGALVIRSRKHRAA